MQALSVLLCLAGAVSGFAPPRGEKAGDKPAPAVHVHLQVEIIGTFHYREKGAYVETIPAIPGRGICVSYPAPADCSTVLMYGQKRDLNAYLAATPGAPTVSTVRLPRN